MKQIEVEVNDKEVKAYRYADIVILVTSNLIRDSDQTIIMDADGFRYKRKIVHNTCHTIFYEFWKI